MIAKRLPKKFIHCAYAWLGIECLVKTFDRGEDGKVDIDEISRLLNKDSEKDPKSLAA